MKRLSVMIASVAAAMAAGSADATYRYDLVVVQAPAGSLQYPDNQLSGSFSFRTEGLVPSNRTILPSQMDTYSLVSSNPAAMLNFEMLVFVRDTKPGSIEQMDLSDDIWLSYKVANDRNTSGHILSFDNGAFSNSETSTYMNLPRNGVRYATAYLTVTNLDTVPEPATWAMFIGGFGLIGGEMRRREAARVRGHQTRKSA